MAAALYNPEILGLAVSLAEYPFERAFDFQSEARSRSCGSSIALGLDTDQSGQVSSVGVKVAACAIGQASAAIFAREVCGRKTQEVIQATRSVEDWVDGLGPMPDWADLALLEPALAYSARHGAILLPWRAARSALCNPKAAS